MKKIIYIGKNKNVDPELLNTVADIYANNDYGVNVSYWAILQGIIAIDNELEGKLAPNLYEIASLGFIRILYAPEYKPWLLIDCAPILCEHKTNEYEGLYVGVNLTSKQVFKGLELCKIWKPRWLKNIDEFGIPHLNNGDEIKFDAMGRIDFSNIL